LAACLLLVPLPVEALERESVRSVIAGCVDRSMGPRSRTEEI
jgi:hypothetical protein